MVAFRRHRKLSTSDEDPTSPIAVQQGPVAWQDGSSGDEWRPADPGTSEHASVIGPTSIQQIVVGSPSPLIEPVPPSDRFHTLAFRPDVVIDGWSTSGMTLRGVSQRGHLHRYNGAPRQDDFAIHRLADGRVIVLVADGVSEAVQSHIGASIAVKQAAEWLRSNIGPNLIDLDWSALAKHTAYALTVSAQSLFGLAEPDPFRAEKELATTLVCAVIEPTGPCTLRAHLFGVGDSGAWVLSSGRFVEAMEGKAPPASGVASSAVSALPRIPTEITPTIVDLSANEVLLVGTDGIGDPLGGGDGGVGNLFHEILTRQDPPSLIEFAHAVDFSRENFDDDRTLVAIWPRGVEQWQNK